MLPLNDAHRLPFYSGDLCVFAEKEMEQISFLLNFPSHTRPIAREYSRMQIFITLRKHSLSRIYH